MAGFGGSGGGGFWACDAVIEDEEVTTDLSVACAREAEDDEGVVAIVDTIGGLVYTGGCLENASLQASKYANMLFVSDFLAQLT